LDYFRWAVLALSAPEVGPTKPYRKDSRSALAGSPNSMSPENKPEFSLNKLH